MTTKSSGWSRVERWLSKVRHHHACVIDHTYGPCQTGDNRNVWHNKDFLKPNEKQPQPEETVLDEAKGLVYGDREEEYSHPAVDFERIARFWRAYFQAQGQGAVNIGAEDVAKLMILLKISRLMNSYHHDSVVDIAGYALCLARLEEK